MKYLVGIIGILAGAAMLKYTENFYRLFGRWNWAEQAFTSGGTRTGIKLVAILVIIFAFVIMTDSLQQFGQLITAPFRGS